MRFEVEKRRFLKVLASLGFSKKTLSKYETVLDYFGTYLLTCNINDLRDISIKEAEGFLKYLRGLKHHRYKRPLSGSYMYGTVSCVKKLYSFLYKEDRIIKDPFARVSFPAVFKTLPFCVLTIDEVNRLLDSAGELHGIWGRAILELLYGAALRSGEVCNLELEEVNLDERILFVKQGKGGKDRVVPLVGGTVKLLRLYLKSRYRKNTRYLFTGKRAPRLTIGIVGHVVSSSAGKAGIKKRVTAHSLRHTCATHLLEGGMDIIYIQKFLGHEYVTTTEVYTRVHDKELIKVYRKTHPRA